MMKILRILLITLVCVAALAAAAWYVFDPKFAKSSKAVASQGHGHGANEKGHDHDEGVKLTDAQVAASGIELLPAGPQELRDILRLNGMIQPNQETLVKVTPRFPGVIRSMRKRLGDKVRKDEVLATVESNQSLTTYELKAPIDGTVIDRDGTLGEFLTLKVPDLTQLSKLNAGKFPEERVMEVIDGRADVKVHGMRDMPVWGDWFNREAAGADTGKQARELIVNDRIASLINYVKSIQVK